MDKNQFNKPDQFNKGVKSEKDTLTHKAGDKIERLGEKVTNAGAEKLGKAIYNAGNKIEHMGQNKK